MKNVGLIWMGMMMGIGAKIAYDNLMPEKNKQKINKMINDMTSVKSNVK